MCVSMYICIMCQNRSHRIYISSPFFQRPSRPWSSNCPRWEVRDASMTVETSKAVGFHGDVVMFRYL